MQRQWTLVLAWVGAGGLILGACGGDGEGGGVGENRLTASIVAEILDDPDSPFDGDRVSAECFAPALVSSIGVGRLEELGFGADSVPNHLRAAWTTPEIDAFLEAFEGCVDIAERTRSWALAEVSEDLVDCVLDEVGDRFAVEMLRAELEAGTDETAIDAALDAAASPVRDALATCGDGADGPDEASDGDGAAAEDPDPSLLPDAVAPVGLGEVLLPEDADATQVLFDALPAELSPGARQNEPAPPGETWAVYGNTRSCAPATLRAGDLSSLPEGSYPPGWTAEWEVALFATGADWEVEGAGRDRGTFWVTWRTTCGGEGVDDAEVFAATWGAEGGSLVFTAVAVKATDRDELIRAFVAAAPTRDLVGDDDVRLARSVLLNRNDLGSEWSSLPRSDDSDPTADAAEREAFEAEPACSTAVEQAEKTGIPLTELLEQLVPDAPAKAESPSFTYVADGTSNVEHTVSVLAASEEITTQFRLLREIGWPECMMAVFDDLVQAGPAFKANGATVVDYAVVETPVVFGADGFGARFVLTVADPEGDTTEFTFDLSVAAVGRAVSAVVQTSLDGAIDDLDAYPAVAHSRVETEFG